MGCRRRAVAEIARLAETLEFDLTRDLGYRYPGCEDVKASARRRELVQARADEAYARGHARRGVALARIDDELAIIRQLARLTVCARAT